MAINRGEKVSFAESTSDLVPEKKEELHEALNGITKAAERGEYEVENGSLERSRRKVCSKRRPLLLCLKRESTRCSKRAKLLQFEYVACGVFLGDIICMPIERKYM